MEISKEILALATFIGLVLTAVLKFFDVFDRLKNYFAKDNNFNARENLWLGEWEGAYHQKSVNPDFDDIDIEKHRVYFYREGENIFGKIIFQDFPFEGKKVNETLIGEMVFHNSNMATLVMKDQRIGSEYVAIAICTLDSSGHLLNCTAVGCGAVYAGDKHLVAKLDEAKKLS